MHQVAKGITNRTALAALLGLATGLALLASSVAAGARTENWCATQTIYDQKARLDPKLLSPDACPTYGLCDNPTTRDTWSALGDEPIVYIRLYFHVFAENDGSNPAATPEDVDSQVVALNAAYLPHRIQFVYQMRTINSTQYRWLTADNEFNAMKTAYNINPSQQCNIYVADVDIDGQVYSFGTFPWDSDALGAHGGIVMNDSQFWPSDGGTLPHEMGHNLGLWHTHHGVSEVTQCSECWESPQATNRDYNGDFCSDTDPTPVSYQCAPPGGTDPCTGDPWGETDPQNYMSYAPSFCYEEFTLQQSGRMRCWLHNTMVTWAIPLDWSSDTALGPSPLAVGFQAQSPRTVSAWNWNFGDGGTSTQQNPSHLYQTPGYYDVSLSITSPQGVVSETKTGMASIYSDTLRVDTIQCLPGQDVRVAVYLHNFLPIKEITVPFTWAGPLNLVFDSFSTAGLRTNFFEVKNLAGYQPSQKRLSVYLNATSSGAGPYLTAGAGAVVSLWFSVPAGATGGVNPIALIDYSSYHPQLKSYAGTYPAYRTSGSVTYKTTCCTGPSRGNVDMSTDNLITMSDLTVMIDHLFITLAALPCDDAANVDLSPDKLITMSDMTVLIDHLFITLAPLSPCP
jgi:PKD repeat protein